MNTPAHLLLNLALLQSQRLEPQTHSLQSTRTGWWIAAGALLPDLPMFGFFLWQTAWVGAPQELIWGDLYFRESWQNLFDVFNSVPLALLGLAISLKLSRRGPALLFASVLLHCALDLPLHHDDGHAHFQPLSNWRFQSPVSYWDPRHLGWIGAGFETIVVLGSSIALRARSKRRWLRAVLVGLCVLSVGGYTAGYVLRMFS